MSVKLSKGGWGSGSSMRISQSRGSMPGRRIYQSQSVQGFGSGARIASVSSSSSMALGSGLGMGSSSLGSGLVMGSSSLGSGLGMGSSLLLGNEKVTMQKLNERLHNYLEKVRCLEEANSKLELQIRQYYEKSTPAQRDWTVYWVTIKDLRDQINNLILDNSRLMLQVDNSKLAAEDFKNKFDGELAIRMAVESDINGLRKILDDMTLEKSQLEMEIENLKEELIYIKKNHEEELKGLRGQLSGTVTVDVSTEQGPDVAKALAELREHYDAIATQNKQEAEDWYNQQCITIQQERSTHAEVCQAEKAQLTQLRQSFQGLDMEYQSLLSIIGSLEANLGDVELRYGAQRSNMQGTMTRLEGELMDFRQKIEENVKAYAALMDSKCLLEKEIATYRQLLQGGSSQASSLQTAGQNKTILIRSEVRSEPVVSKTVKRIVEETVNGVVVSSSVEDISIN
ncbi:keratin, type I cytoskeletal 19-like [Chiloscyllium plagiosum]|uniref:keratin, type I cytoskeletal 19-like n=1 Tax=Chiloscyllium plagiosum TaxID=36176 RepID=UPI001CB878B0|nr:keratin, type I cytoskeletal 19-like [Chiloscyllium plagiosum]